MRINKNHRIILILLVAVSLLADFTFYVTPAESVSFEQCIAPSTQQAKSVSDTYPVMHITGNEDLLSVTSQTSFIGSFSQKRAEKTKVRFFIGAVTYDFVIALLCFSVLLLSIQVTTRSQESIIKYIHNKDGQKG